MIKKSKILIVIILSLLVIPAFSQFYNGLHTDFGKNRVQYEDFTWQYLRFDDYDTYFYENGKELAVYTSEIANEKIKYFEKYFELSLQKRIQFLVYNNLSDFRQSNIGLVSGVNKYNIGGTTKILKNKVFIYFDGNRENFKKQITAAIIEIFLNEMIFGTTITARMANSTLISLPEWYLKGLVSYLSNPWNEKIDNIVKDGILTGKFEKFNRLNGPDAIYAGHSIWNYIVNRYGGHVIPNILYLTKTSKNIESGFTFVLGTNSKRLSYDWLNYYEDIYNKYDKNRVLPEDEAIIKKKTRKPRVYQQLKISPDNNLYAYTTNQEGQYRIRIFNKTTGKTKKILKKEHKLVQITDYSYPLLAWHPTGKILTYLIESKGSIWLYFYDIETKKREKREMFGYDKIIDMTYSHNGKRLIFSAVQKGQTDLFLYSIIAHGSKRLTNDIAGDYNPHFTKNDDGIIFSSNRSSIDLKAGDTLQNNLDLYLLTLEKNKPKSITKITDTDLENETSAFEIKNHNYLFLSDANGVNNTYIAKYDSSISYIDTTTHYKYYTKSKPISDYKRSVLSLDYNSKTDSSAKIFLNNESYSLYTEKEDLKNTNRIGDSYFKKREKRLKLYNDSINKIKQNLKDSLEKLLQNRDSTVIIVKSDTSNIDINNYSFDIDEFQAKVSNSKKKSSKSSKKIDGNVSRFQRFYFTNFYINDMVTQVDFSFMNNSYQAFTGTGYYYNPGFNVYFKLGALDLFEDYRITGALRLAGNFDSNEWLVSVENLKKRVDKQVVFHRQVFNNVDQNNFFQKTHTHILKYITKYPFSQVSATKLTIGGRTDRTAILATDSRSLNEPNIYKNWVNAKLEFIFDNSRDLGVNLYSGNKMKIFGEAYKQIDQEKTDLYVVGFDFRHYEKIHRNLIFATRLAGSKSFGESKLIYYLGSVDNWMNLSSRNPTFNQSVQIDYSQEWAFQAVATNMRGFSQNIRNGNTFMVMNNELRWPVFRYFANRPINSDLVNNFQIIGFFDIGTAWTGDTPYSEENKYNQEIRPELPPGSPPNAQPQGPIVLVVDKDKEPIVYGYGVGLRTRLLGYFIRADWAWGIEDQVVQPSIFYLSLSLDF